MQLGVATRLCLHEERGNWRKRRSSGDKDLEWRKLKLQRFVFLYRGNGPYVQNVQYTKRILGGNDVLKQGLEEGELQERHCLDCILRVPFRTRDRRRILKVNLL